jgi:endonuclease III
MNIQSAKILAILRKTYHEPGIRLVHKNPFELLVATILSAQCTDERVNKTTPALFKKYPGPKQLAKANLQEVEQLIRSTGFYHAKARSIITTSQMIMEKFDGSVPNTMEGLLSLRGVARKTANIVLTQGFGKVEGIAVDTHVFRLSRRLGFTKANNPIIIEQDLLKAFPKKHWGVINGLLIDHGRAICIARNPKCESCVLTKYCPSAFKIP